MQDPHGSRRNGISQYFGYVSDEDRARWDAHRRRTPEKTPGILKRGVKGAISSMTEFTSANMQAQLHAAHKVNASKVFDQTHDRVVTTRTPWGSQGSQPSDSSVESVSYRPKGRDQYDDLEF